MSEERENEQAGAAVEQTEPTETQVLAAVERANADAAPPVIDATSSLEGHQERPPIAPNVVPPSAGETETATEVFAAHTPADGSLTIPQPAGVTESAPPPSTPESQVLPPQDGEIRISPDHPMAAFYMQSPMPPELKGNRGAGVLISLLATVVFALVYLGAVALWQAPNFPPSTFLTDGFMPWVLSWTFAAAALSFFIALTLLVLIVGRAGWWIYVLGGFIVAVFVWVVTLLGAAFDASLQGAAVSWHPYLLVTEYGLFFPVIAAALVAREATVWFGAWIGSRGRKVKRQNAEAIVEYERAMAEVQVAKP
jgi:hypothetical protein